MGWRVDSSTGTHVYDTEPLSREDILCRDEEISWCLRQAKEGQRKQWGLIHGRLARSGELLGLKGNYAGDGAIPPAQALAAVTGGTANVAWWAPATYTPIPAQSVQAPLSLRIVCGGLLTSSAASQTITMNPAIGTAVAGQALGPSAALALGSTITNAFWRLEGDVTITKGGTSGTAVANFQMAWGTTAGATPGTPTATNPSNAIFGGGNTVATADFVTAAQGLLIAATPSATGVSVTVTYIHFGNWD